MGRTNPTYRDRLARLEERWADYRRALRRPDGEHFDRLWTHAADHADAAGHQHDERALDLALVSVLLAHERRLAALDERIAALDERAAALAAAPEADGTDGTDADDGPAGDGTAEGG